MTVALRAGALEARPADGGRPARQAMRRWAWRLFRREWRQQLLVLALLTVAVMATTVGAAVVSNLPAPVAARYGTGNAVIQLPGSDPGLASDLASARSYFGTIDVIEAQNVAVPGSVSTIELRAQDPNGPYGHVMLRLDSGHYPVGPDQVAITSNVATEFGLHVGSIWQENGRSLQVVGMVENPENLLDQFGLVAPGEVTHPVNVSILVKASQDQLRQFHLSSGRGVGIDSLGSDHNKTAVAIAVLALATVALIFVGLIAVAGFTVMIQRRMRSLGMLGSLGATDRHLRSMMIANGAVVGAVAAVIGAVAGLVIWILMAPAMASVFNHRINRFDLPWWIIAGAVALAVVTALLAAWWPARTVARLPVVTALSGRPPRPQPAHRFASVGGLILGAGLVLLSFADGHRVGFVIGGILATAIGTLLLAPLTIMSVGAVASRVPISIRLALRDLGRYQARSGAALGAVTLAIGISATIAVSAAASAPSTTGGNLPSNELNIYLSPDGYGGGIPPLSPTQLQEAQASAEQMAQTLHAKTLVPLEQTIVPGESAQADPSGQFQTTFLARVQAVPHGVGIFGGNTLYVATPQLLAAYGLSMADIEPNATILTSQRNLSGMYVVPGGGAMLAVPAKGPGVAGGAAGAGGATPGNRTGPPPSVSKFLAQSGAVIPTIQSVKLPTYSSAPNALITPNAVKKLHLQTILSGWMILTPHPLTTSQIDTAQKTAVGAGLTTETRSINRSVAELRYWSTAIGIMVALGVLGMTVGLIRSETANDLRTLTATGAGSSTRRTLTGATAGALAFLGALLGTAGAYAALLVWHRSNLNPLQKVPTTNLVILLVGLPLVAVVAGWLLAGREPTGVARRPLD